MIVETIRLKKQQNVSLTTYRHEPSPELPNAAVRPAVLVFPGGGYRVCSDREAEPVALGYVAEGYHAFVLRYTVGEDVVFPAPLRDAEAALQMILDNAEAWGVDAERIAVAGFSAGGHLAAALGTMGCVRPAAMILGYACILESISRILLGKVPGLDTLVDSNTPPAFLFATSEDDLVPVENTLRFAAAMDRADRPFEVHVFQKGAHGLSVAKPHSSAGVKSLVEPRVAAWFGMSVDWLKGLWGDFDHSASSSMPGVLSEFDTYSVDVALEHLWKNEACRALVITHIPAFSDEKAARGAMQVSLRVVAGYAAEMITPELLAVLDAELRAIPVTK